MNFKKIIILSVLLILVLPVNFVMAKNINNTSKKNKLVTMGKNNRQRINIGYILKLKATCKPTQEIPWGIKRVRGQEAWPYTSGKNIKVAILDSGISDHSDLKNNIKGEFNTINPGSPIVDIYGHGTHIAGIIGAQNNDFGVVGIAPKCDVYGVKILDDIGWGYLSDLIEGINWCIENKMQVINISSEVEEDYQELNEVIKKALNSGIIIVAAAGNTYSGNVTYPAGYEGVISVNGIDENDQICDFSARGKIDFAAPGTNINSTYLDNNYTIWEGTSTAAAHVSGLIALMYADFKNDIDKDGIISSREIRSALDLAVESNDIIENDEVFGKGILKSGY